MFRRRGRRDSELEVLFDCLTDAFSCDRCWREEHERNCVAHGFREQRMRCPHDLDRSRIRMPARADAKGDESTAFRSFLEQLRRVDGRRASIRPNGTLFDLEYRVYGVP